VAHHSSTPKSVLDAPQRTVVRTFIPTGATRQERRHGVVPPKDLGVVELAVYLKALGARRNPTAVRDTPRRGRRVTRCPR
jgi:hypothetical protein